MADLTSSDEPGDAAGAMPDAATRTLEADVLVEALVVDEVLAGPPVHRRRHSNLPVALVASAVGLLLLLVATAGLPSSPAELRLLLGGLGVGAVALGIDGVCKRVWGPSFPTFLWFAVGWIGLVVLAATVADLLPLTEAQEPSKTLMEPSLLRPDLLSGHPLGTDRQGLDVLGGIVYGLRVSLIVGIGTVAIGMTVGTALGIVAGFHRRGWDRVIDLLTTSMLAFPPLILLMGVAAVVDRNVRNITLALAVVSVPIFVRLARANTMVLMQRDFILAARSLGAKSRRIMRKDLVPGVLRPAAAYAFVVLAMIIVAEASLSFLGLGVPRPQPTLGNMISAGQADFERHPHAVFLPAAALFITVLCLNRIGEEAQRRWSQREQKL